MTERIVVPKPSVKVDLVMSTENFAAISRAAIDVRERSRRAVSTSVVLDRIIAAADLNAIIAELCGVQQTEKIEVVT